MGDLKRPLLSKFNSQPLQQQQQGHFDRRHETRQSDVWSFLRTAATAFSPSMSSTAPPWLSEPNSGSRSSELRDFYPDIGTSGIIRVTPCTRRKFYGQYELCGSKLFLQLEEAALAGADDPEEELCDVASECREEPDALEAFYRSYHSCIKIHAMHLLASLGSIKVMGWLRDTLDDEDDENVLDKRAVLYLEGGGTHPHYTPLMSALFMSQTPAVIWLLEHGAAATAVNVDGLTPMHILASHGLPHETGEARFRSLEKVAAKLVEKSADLSVLSGSMPNRHDAEALRLRSKTALELAAGKRSLYPKQMLHLLTTSYHKPSESRLLNEVDIIAMANPKAAELLLDKMKEKVTAEVKERLRQEVAEQFPYGHMDTFVRILKMSPISAAELLNLLMAEPVVSDPQRYPLPMYTVLPDGDMLCTYQSAGEHPMPVWENRHGPPRWHTLFRMDLPADPLLHQNVYEVRVKVLQLPGVLDFRVLCILSMLWPGHWEHMRIFAQVPVYGLISCMWARFRCLHYLSLTYELHVCAMLVWLGLLGPTSSIIRDGFQSVWIANILCSVHNLWCGAWSCRSSSEFPQRRFLLDFARRDLGPMLALSLLVVMHNQPPTAGVQKTLVAVNIIIRCFGVMMMCRAVPVIGPLIIAVLYSFIPMMGMFLLMAMVFVTFWFAFMTMRDDNRDGFFVFVSLFQALFLTDTDSTQSISGLDLGHQQTLDIGLEMYNGDEDPWLLTTSSVCMISATTCFSLVLLNLTVGMYAKYYEEMEPFADLIFRQQRAAYSVALLLRSAPPDGILEQIASTWGYAPLLCTCGFCCLCYAVALLRGNALGAGVLIAVCVQLGQVSLLLASSVADESRHYLWICHRADYSDVDMQVEKHELALLRKQMADMQLALGQVHAKVLKEPDPSKQFRASVRSQTWHFRG